MLDWTTYLNLAIFALSFSSNIIALTLFPHYKEIEGKRNYYSIALFGQFVYDLFYSTMALVCRIELLVIHNNVVIHPVYSYLVSLSYETYAIIVAILYISSYGNIGATTAIIVLRYFQIVKSIVLTRNHVIIACSVTFLIPTFMAFNLWNAFDRSEVPDYAYQYYKQEGEVDELIAKDSKSFVMNLGSWKLIFVLILYIGYINCNYVINIIIYRRYLIYLSQFESLMSPSTAIIQREYSRILMLQAFVPTIGSVSLTIYIVCLFLQLDVKGAGTLAIFLQSAVPSINSFLFLTISSKNRRLLKNRLVAFKHIFIKSNTIEVVPADMANANKTMNMPSVFTKSTN